MSHTYGLEKDGKKIRETEAERQILHKIFTPVFFTPNERSVSRILNFSAGGKGGEEGRRKNNNTGYSFLRRALLDAERKELEEKKNEGIKTFRGLTCGEREISPSPPLFTGKISRFSACDLLC